MAITVIAPRESPSTFVGGGAAVDDSGSASTCVPVVETLAAPELVGHDEEVLLFAGVGKGSLLTVGGDREVDSGTAGIVVDGKTTNDDKS